MGKTHNQPVVIVVDFGAQYAQLIARRVREARIYSEIVPASTPLKQIISRKPAAVILSGGPQSVYSKNAPKIASALFESGIPIFGICYGFQVMTQSLGGDVKKTNLAEFGRTELTVNDTSTLFHKQPKKQKVWMSHNDSVQKAPKGFQVTASTKQTNIAAYENKESQCAGVQFHPEVMHSEYGQKTLQNFLYNIAQITPIWTQETIIKEQIQTIKKQVGKKHVICGLSGGVDSAVAAAIVQKAIGKQLTCVFVDHGLLRQGESEQIQKDFKDSTGVDLITVAAKTRFLKILKGVQDPEKKRKIIGAEFIACFEKATKNIQKTTKQKVEFLVQGTLYPDVVESGTGKAANIKTHHNVGGLPKDLQFQLIEPLRELFKDEVRQIGSALGLPNEIINRQPFPGPGLAVRIVGCITEKRINILQKADHIARQEITNAGLDKDIWQCPVVLLADVRSVGVKGDGRSYGHPIVLRPVSSEDAMTADWTRLPYNTLEKISTRITNEVPEINRVILDVTSKPPATIEWE